MTTKINLPFVVNKTHQCANMFTEFYNSKFVMEKYCYYCESLSFIIVLTLNA